MFFEIANLILSVLTFIVLIIYAYCTYLIAKDVYVPFVSFSFKQISISPTSKSPSHISFNMLNKSKVEVEVFGKLWSKVEDKLFEGQGGFYGNGYSWILQPFTEGFGHFELRGFNNKEGIELGKFVKTNKIPSIKFNFQIKYRKVGSKKWKKSSPQKYAYNFDKELLWLDV